MNTSSQQLATLSPINIYTTDPGPDLLHLKSGEPALPTPTLLLELQIIQHQILKDMPPPPTSSQRPPYSQALTAIRKHNIRRRRRIFQKPSVRKLLLRPHRTPSFAKRTTPLEAALANTGGELPETGPFANCARGKRPSRPLRPYVVMPEEFDRACCNYRYRENSLAYTLHRQFQSHPKTCRTVAAH